MEQTLPFRDPASSASIPVRPFAGHRDRWLKVVSFGRSRMAHSIAWSVLGSGIAQGGSFLSSIVLARVLGRQAFGQFALIQSTITALTYLASLGLGLTATKYISEYRATQPEKIGKVLGLSSMLVALAAAFFSIALFVCAPTLAGPAGHAALTAGLRLSTLSIFFLTLTGCQIGILAGFEAFRSIAWIGIASGLASPLLSWMGAAKYGVPGAVLAQCVGAFLLWLLYEAAVRAEYRARRIAVEYRGAWQLRSILTRVSIPAAACGMVGSVAAWGSNAILARSCGYGELALFSAAGNMRSIVIFLPSLVLRVVSPRLNHVFASGDLPGYSRLFWGAVGVNGGMALFVASIAFFAGQQFVHLFGKEFAGSDWLLGLILGSVVVEVIANNLYQALFASSRFWWNLAVMTLWAALLLAVSGRFAPRYGATGVAVAFLAAWILAAAFYAAEARRQTTSGGGR